MMRKALMNEKILKLAKHLICTSVLMVFVSSVNAATLTIEPENSQISTGSTFIVSVVVNGLGDHAPPSVSTFDLDLAYDGTLFSFNNVVFGPGLGDESQSESRSGFTPSLGLINVWEYSLLDVSGLEALQGSSVVLAKFEFTASKHGVGGFDLLLNTLGDGYGDPIPAVLIGGQVSSIDEPPTIWLFVSLLSSALIFKYSKQQTIV
jgi:hypothetical protein